MKKSPRSLGLKAELNVWPGPGEFPKLNSPKSLVK